MKRRNFYRLGVTLTEAMISVAILGTVAFTIPLALKIFNSLAYLQQTAQLQNEAKTFLWQLSHEIENAYDVQVIAAPGSPIPNPDYLRIFVYDFRQYQGSDPPGNFNQVFEMQNMFKDTKTVAAGAGKFVINTTSTGYVAAAGQTVCNYGEIVYQIVGEKDATTDYNNNGVVEGQPYMLRKQVWTHTVAGLRTENDLITYDTFFLGKIQPTKKPWTNTSVRTFYPDPNSDQLITVTLRLKPSYTRPKDPPRIYTAVATILNKKPE